MCDVRVISMFYSQHGVRVLRVVGRKFCTATQNMSLTLVIRTYDTREQGLSIRHAAKKMDRIEVEGLGRSVFLDLGGRGA